MLCIPSSMIRVAIQSFALRSKHHSASYYQGYDPHHGLLSPPRYKYSLIPLRLTYQPYVKGRFSWILLLCTHLGWVVYLRKSDLGPSQVAIYLELKFNCLISTPRQAQPIPLKKIVEHWVSITKEFVTDQALTAVSWLHLVQGHIVSLEKLVPYVSELFNNSSV